MRQMQEKATLTEKCMYSDVNKPDCSLATTDGTNKREEKTVIKGIYHNIDWTASAVSVICHDMDVHTL